MVSLFASLILLGLVAVAWAGVEAIFSMGRREVPKVAAQPPSANPESLPYVKGERFLSVAERSLYEAICRLLPRHAIFAKVRLVDVIHVQKDTAEWQSHKGRIDRKRLDFVICDSEFAPVMTVRVDDPSADDCRHYEGDKFVREALAAAGLAMVQVKTQRRYEQDELRVLFSPHIAFPAQSAAEVSAEGPVYAPPVGWRPAV